MQNSCIALIGLGAIGTPLAHLLWKKYCDDFILLADDVHADRLRSKKMSINGEEFSPQIVSHKDDLKKPVKIVFICVKNYSLESSTQCLKGLITDETIIVPLQNGVYSYQFMRSHFPDNIILEGFAQGPNTTITEDGFEYQNPGEYHIGSYFNHHIESLKDVYTILTDVGIKCYWDEDIVHSIWKKLMLNVAGNAMTALTGINYSMLRNSPEAQKICRIIMREFKFVAALEDILITEDDIEDVMNYFLSYKESKHTSMLEDALNKRMTENEYIAGYIRGLAEKHNVDAPFIDMIYSLMKIKEDVYRGMI